MAKFKLRLKARELRSKGESVKKIAKKLGISKGTASLWVRDIILTEQQLNTLRNSALKGAELGRLRGALVQKERRLMRIQQAQQEGREKIKDLTTKELLLTGLALYWAEGSKKNGRFEFCNSDPKMIQFILHWLTVCFGISYKEIICRIGINVIHEQRDREVKMYWSSALGIPIDQFIKTSFKKIPVKKVYANSNEHFGTLSISVRKSSRLYLEVLGLIEGLHSFMST